MNYYACLTKLRKDTKDFYKERCKAKKTILLCLIGSMLLSNLAGCRLNHFIVYDADDIPMEKFRVKLIGQFDKEEREVLITATNSLRKSRPKDT